MNIHTRSFILRVIDELLEPDERDELAERMRERALANRGEPDAAVTMVQDDGKETPRLQGEPHAVARVRAAMFNTAIGWREYELDLE